MDSIRVFQNRKLSGRPSRSRAPGKSSRKKSASCRSNDRSPLGTILIARRPNSERPGVIGVVVASTVEGDAGITTLGCTEAITEATSVCRKCLRSSPMSRAVL